MEMIHTCSVCNKKFNADPYYMHEGGLWFVFCSTNCLEQGQYKFNKYINKEIN